MPRVQFSFPPRDINITKDMPSPRRIGELDHWYKQARKVIPEIPNLQETDWFIFQQEITESSIVFEIHDSVGQKCAVVIDRRHNLVGG